MGIMEAKVSEIQPLIDKLLASGSNKHFVLRLDPSSINPTDTALYILEKNQIIAICVIRFFQIRLGYEGRIVAVYGKNWLWLDRQMKIFEAGVKLAHNRTHRLVRFYKLFDYEPRLTAECSLNTKRYLDERDWK